MVITHDERHRRRAAAPDRAARRARRGGLRRPAGGGMSALAPSRIGAADVLRTGSLGLRTRRLRAGAVGARHRDRDRVDGRGARASRSPRKADLLAQLDELGTNLLQVAPGQSFFGDEAQLPESAAAMLGRVAGVQDVAAVRDLADVTVRRNDRIDPAETGGIAVAAADPALAAPSRAQLRAGASSTRRRRAIRPSCSAPARPTSSGSTTPASRVYLGGRWFTVIGILDAGHARARARQLGADRLRRPPSAGSARSATRRRSTSGPTPTAIESGARDLLGATANPERPEEVEVSRPSDALEARGGREDRVHVAVPRARARSRCSSAASGSRT